MSVFEQWFIKEYNVNVEKEQNYKNTDTYDISMYAWNAALEAAMEYNAVDLENLKEKP